MTTKISWHRLWDCCEVSFGESKNLSHDGATVSQVNCTFLVTIVARLDAIMGCGKPNPGRFGTKTVSISVTVMVMHLQLAKDAKMRTVLHPANRTHCLRAAASAKWERVPSWSPASGEGRLIVLHKQTFFLIPFARFRVDPPRAARRTLVAYPSIRGSVSNRGGFSDRLVETYKDYKTSGSINQVYPQNFLQKDQSPIPVLSIRENTRAAWRLKIEILLLLL